MNDDWRLQIDLHDVGDARSLVELLDSSELQHDLSAAYHDRVVISRDDARVFLYSDSREQAEHTRELVLALAKRQSWSIDPDLKRWHPSAEEWEDPDIPLPVTNAARLAEHEALIATERRETEERGYPEFEVRADLPSRHDAIRFAEQLRGEGLPVVHRWRFLLVGATDEDSAKALADRIRDEAPSSARVAVEGTWRAAYAERSPSPFAVLGGLGG